MNKKDKIKKNILSLLCADQAMRKKWADSGFNPEFYKKEIDKENQKKIKEIVKSVGGWPKLSEFGEETTNALWVLVQHTPNLKFHKLMLKKMEKLPRSEISFKNIAKTIDRIRRRENKKQLYGTSFTIDLQSGKLRVDPIENEYNIDKRRKKMGLDSFKAQKERAYKSYKEHLKNRKDFKKSR